MLVIGRIEYIRLQVAKAVALTDSEAVGEFALLAVWSVVSQTHINIGGELVYILVFVTVTVVALVVGDAVYAVVDNLLVRLVEIAVKTDVQVMSFLVKAF